MKPMDWALMPFRRYFDFSGRSSRAEYWYFTALMWLAYLIFALLELTFEEGEPGAFTLIDILFSLVTLIPSIAVSVRRLHDTNRSGFVLLRQCILLFLTSFWAVYALAMDSPGGVIAVVAIVLIALRYLFLMMIEGDRGPNPYGPNPYGLTYGY